MIRTGVRGRISSRYEIAVILFYASVIAFIPFVLVFTYVFDLDESINIDIFMRWLIGVDAVAMTAGTVVLVLRRDALKRQVKPSYPGEFVYLLSLAGAFLLGFVVFYDYLGGDRAYIANILVFLAVFLVYVLIRLGRRYFKFDYMKK